MGSYASSAGAVLMPLSEASPATRYQALIRLAQAIRECRDSAELFHLMATELRQVVPFDCIAQYDEAANKTHWHIDCECHDPGGAPPSVIPREETVAWWVFENQQPLAINSLGRETRFRTMIDKFQAYGIQSVCALPLTTAHRKLGSLLIASREPGAYLEDEVQFLSLVVNQVALAMDDARNFQASQLAQDRLRLLLDLTNRVVANLELQDLLCEVSVSIRRVMQCDGVGVTLPDPETGLLRLCALDFLDSKGIVHLSTASPLAGDSVIAEVFRAAAKPDGNRPLVLMGDDLQRDPVALAEGVGIVCHVPLIGHGRPLGVLTLGRKEQSVFSTDDLDFLSQIANQIAIAVENALGYQQIAELKNQLAQEKLYLEDEIRSELNFEEIIGTSEALRRALKEVETVAPTDSTVLIYGETGTGKELIARAVHNLGSRRSNAFVKLNCAAIPTGLLESELFGHEKGAFTGAIAQRVGRFELAHRGTVFLDEIGEVPLELQPKLLRVLQEREFELLGSSRTLRTDARLIAATNRDLRAMVEDQTFRSDLFYRLNVFPIYVPSLRERPDDIPLLVRHFVQQFSRRANKTIDTIPAETMRALVKYHWPGNIRELQNVIERAVILSTGPGLKVPVDDLKPASSVPAPESAALNDDPIPQAAFAPESMRTVLEETERRQILNALEQANWVISGPNGAAARVGMKRTTLQFRIQKLGIRIGRTGQ